MPDSSKTGLPANRAEILELLLKRKRHSGDAIENIIPRGMIAPVPLSYSQERLWFLDQLTPDSAAYVFCNIVHLTGPVDLPALRKAYQALVDRHEIFRTRFRADDGNPEQEVLAELELDITEIDLSDLGSVEAREQLQKLAIEEASRPFDLTRAPLLRISIVRISATRYEVLQTMHHIVYDGWSLAILFRELAEFYDAFASDREVSLAPLDIQYGDYSIWQRKRFDDGEFDKQLEFWSESLKGAPAVLELPKDRPRPPIQSHNGALYRLQLSRDVSASLKKLATDSDCTLFAVLLAAFKILLYRYTGEEDILVGTPVAGRNQRQIEELIGFFVNSIVLRTSLADNPSVGDLLKRVRRTCAGAFANQDVPFERIVEAISPDRDLSHNPVFQVMFAFQNTPPPVNRLGEVNLGLEEVDNETSLFDLTLNLHESKHGIYGYVEYCSDLFDQETIARLVDHYRKLLEEMVTDSNQPLAALEIMPIEERQRILYEWNATKTDYPEGRCIHELIESQAEENPKAPAVYQDGRKLSYAELDRRANQLAHVLISFGIAPNGIVALCLERSFEMLIGIFGILKAGGAYLPLDPKYPEDRLRFMLGDSGAKYLVTRSEFLSTLPGDHGKAVLFDLDESLISGQSGSRPEVDLDERNLAYVIYTSGSTGKPKGVPITHNNLVHSTSARQSCYPDSVSAFLLLSSYSFDSSVAGIFWTLCDGGMLCLPAQDEEHDVLAIGELLGKTASSHLLALPSLYALILKLCPPRQLKSLKVAIVAGEACSTDLVLQHQEVLPETGLYNEYGPTEGTVWCTVYRAEAPFELDTMPIGKPIDNMRTYILDRSENPVPIGVPGELYIAGLGLSGGYLNRPELNREKFVERTDKDFVAGRFYRTGDLARYRTDGNIEYLGRIDEQVKIRGFRIELGEIENRLLSYPAIDAAVVIPVQEQPGNLRLAAYCVQREGHSTDTERLRKHLREELPDYMLPAGFVFIAEIPLTPNGKVDKKALPPPVFGAIASPDRPTTRPESDNERLLASIWQDVLGVENPGVNDNFFELGGDSILSIQIIARARQAGLSLKPRQVFEYQTIAELAGQAESSGGSQSSEQGTVTGSLPLTPIQIWFFEHRFENPQHWNQPAVIKTDRDIDWEVFGRSWQQLLDHHDGLRSRFLRNDGFWEATIAETGDEPAIIHVDATGLDTIEQSSLFDSAVAQQQASLDLAKAPAIRIVCFDCGPNQAREIVIIAHHLLVDGITWRFLIEDLNTLYQQNIESLPPDLPHKTSSYRAWAEALEVYAGDPVLLSEIDFWRAQASNLELPVDGSVELDIEGDARTLTAVLDKDFTTRLLQECHNAYRTRINDLLLTALLRTFRRWTGIGELLLTLEGHGREDIFDGLDISRTAGWFTTLFPVLLRVEGEDPGTDIKAIKEQLRAIPRHGIGYSVLRYLGSSDLKAQLSGLPEPRVLFNYLGQLDVEPAEITSFTWVQKPTIADHSADCTRDHWLDFNALVFENQLRIDIGFNPKRHAVETVESLAFDLLDQLRDLVTHCLSPGVHGYTPSDFRLASIDQSTLDSHPILGQPGVRDLYPLSPMQEGILFHYIDQEQSGTYIEQYLCEFDGSLMLDAFREAWDTLVQRHDILRTAFIWKDIDRPLQAVREQASVAWDIHDWRDLNEEEFESRLSKYLEADRMRGFKVDRPPLMRMALFRSGEKRHRLVWTFHHLLMDGWCLDLVLREVFSHYNRLLGLDAEPLSTPRPYRNFIAWLQRQDLEAARLHWSKLLGGFDTPNQIQLPSPRETGAETSAKCVYEIPQALSAEFLELSKKYRLTPSTLVQGAWALVLGCYSRSQDVVFGVTVSGRTPEVVGIEQMIGLFINTLPTRVRLDPGVSCLELLTDIQSQQVNASEFEYTSLARIQSWSDVQGGDALFESIVVYENFPDGVAASKDLKIGAQDAIEQTNYPLTIMASAHSRLQLGVSYDPRRFQKETVERIITHMQSVIESFVRDVEAPCGEVSIMSEDEENQILHEWNQSGRELPDSRCVPQMVDEISALYPDRLALKDPSRELSYARLHSLSDGLAALLRANRVSTGSCVGVLLSRSIGLPMTLLAVMKAGAAYLPIDDVYPDDRILYMLEDSAASVLVTESSLRRDLSAYSGEIILLDEIWDRLEAGEIKYDAPRLEFDDLAYLIYTSGSTGLPKGVEITHHGLRNLVNWHNHSYQITQEDRASLLAGVAFDASVWEIWPYLCVGASLHMPADEIRLSPVDTLHWMCENSVSVSFVPTPLAEIMLLEEMPPDLSLRYLLTGGDKLHAPPRRRLPFELINHYGPTENTVVATAGKIAVDRTGSVTPSIGKPTDNTRVYVLDSYLRPVPVGVPGELCVSGIGLARGYRNQPKMTAAAFVDNPFGSAEFGRMYKTGDLVRFIPDGDLEFLGRIDHQVKIRGYRIELGEIETQLILLDDVQDAIVIVHEDRPGDRKLVAYLVCRDQVQDAETVKTHLAGKLPAYMVPTYIVFLESFPLTPNGKIDRRSLPPPIIETEDTASDFSEVPGPIEKSLLDVWISVLGIDGIGVHSNFFELGGDSIISIQVVSKARQIGLAITTRQVFECPTVAQLARVVKQTGPISREEAGEVSGYARLTPIQHWFFERDLVERQHWNQAYLFDFSDPLDPDMLRAALNAIIAHHDSLRFAYRETAAGEWEQEYTASVELELPVIDLSDLDEQAREQAIFENSSAIQADMNLAEGRIVRCGLFDLGDERGQRLLIAIHHLAVDGVSWRILIEDLQQSLEQLSAGEVVNLPQKSASFQRWGDHLLANLELAGTDLGFWSEQLAGSTTIPVDRWWQKPNTVDSAGIVVGQLDRESTDNLLQRASNAYNTQINDLLLTALARTLAKCTRCSRHYIHLESHGREPYDERIDLDRTVGWFTSLFPLMLECEPDSSLPGCIMNTKEKLRQVPVRGISYGMLRYLGQDEDRQFFASNDNAQILFNYLGQMDRSFESGNLLKIAEEIPGEFENRRNIRSHLIEINCEIIKGQLKMSWTFSRNKHRRATIEQLTRSMTAELEGIIEHCLDGSAGRFTPSDFPLAAVDQDLLDRLHDRFQMAIADIYPLAPIQQGMLYHRLTDPESPVSFEQYRLTLEGRIDPDKIRAAWQRVIDNHDALRTAFYWEKIDSPLQMVLKAADLPWRYVDLRNENSKSAQRQIDEYLDSDKKQGFDLDTAPLTRVALFQTEDASGELVWSFHHIILDGWSMALVLEEFLFAYDHLDSRRPAGAVSSYGSYIAWLQAQDRAGELDYWRDYLDEFARPTLIQQAIVQSGELEGSGNDELSLSVSESTSAEIIAVTQRHGITINTLVQASWAMLLGAYCDSRDIVFGSTVSGRPGEVAGIEAIVGNFINIIPVRVKLDPEASMLDALQDLQGQQMSSRQYEFSPLGDIHEQSSLPKNSPFFDSLLVFENYPLNESSEGGSDLRIVASSLDEMTNFPLNLIVFPGARLRLVITFQQDVFARSTIQRLLNQLANVIDLIIGNLHRPIGAISIDDQAGSRRILTGQSVSMSALPLLPSETDTRSVAIRDDGVDITYAVFERELSRRIAVLRDRGLKAGSTIILAGAEKGEFVISLLACLIGEMNVSPLGAESPDRQWQLMQDKLQAGFTIGTNDEQFLLARAFDAAEDGFREALADPTGHGGKMVCLHLPDGQKISLSFRLLREVALELGDRLQIGPGTLLSLAIPADSVAAIVLVIAVLSKGGCVEFCSVDAMGSSSAEPEWTAGNRIFAGSAYSVHKLLDAKSPDYPDCILCLADVLDEILLKELLVHSTEIWKMFVDPFSGLPMALNPCHRNGGACLGDPLPGSRFFVEPRGGHNLVGAKGLLDYRVEGDLEAERDPRPVPVPAAHLDAGEITLLPGGTAPIGNNGMRVDLARIADAAIRHPSISDAATVVLPESHSRFGLQTRLYCVLEPKVAITVTELRNHLKAELLPHEVPMELELDSTLVRDDTGKLDRALIAKLIEDESNTANFQPPEGEMEERLAAIWREMLGIDKVGRNDHFFDLGGNSFMSMNLLARIRDELTFEVNPQILLFGSLAQIAATCDVEKEPEIQNKPWYRRIADVSN